MLMTIYFSTEGRTEEIAQLESVMGADFDMEFGGHAGTWTAAVQKFEDNEYERALEILDQAGAMGLDSDLRLALGDDSVILTRCEGVF